LGTPININDQWTRFLVFTADEVSTIPETVLKDKIVLIGSVNTDVKGSILTPFSVRLNDHRPIYGIEIHATVLDMMLRNRFLSETPTMLVMILLFVEAFVCGWLFLSVRLIGVIMSFFAVAIGMITISTIGFIEFNLLIPIVLQLVSILTERVFPEKYTMILVKH
jgi:CHASE2 domain-containing sensor protein